MKKSRSGGTIVNIIFIIIGIAALILILIPVFKSMSLDKKIEKANDNAKIIYDGAQKWLDETKLQGIVLTASSTTTELHFKSENASSLKSDMAAENDFIIMDLTTHVSKKFPGGWYAVVDPHEYKVVYALWSESEIQKDMLNKIGDKISQKYSVEKNGNVIGCYPISSGTYKE
ncbi:MAG: hypothetical protein WC900_03460 [Oscillospiraceae bacterium]|jgi:hypothetical protein